MSKLIYLKTDAEIATLKANGDLLGRTHAEVAKAMKVGVTTKELNRIAEEFIKDNGGIPSFKGYGPRNNPFPAALCISVNDIVVHGIPSIYTVKDGDIISIDCGFNKNGFHADSAYTYGVGNVAEQTVKLLQTTKASLFEGIEKAIPGLRVGDIGFAIQSFCEKAGYTIVRELVGHGVGRHLHEEPQVPNYGRRGDGAKLKEGMVIAIEPMVNLGTKSIHQENDGWTIRTHDRKPSAHFEHTVAVRKHKAEILTTFKYIEEAITNNADLVKV